MTVLSEILASAAAPALAEFAAATAAIVLM